MNYRVRVVLKNLDVIIAGIALGILVAITFLGVVMRYIFSNPFVWQEELQISLFLWVAFFGSSAAFRTKGHVEISMVFDRFPKRVQRVLSVLIYCVVAISLIFLMLKSSDMVKMFFETTKSTPVLSIPSVLIYSVVPVCSMLMLVNYSIVTWKDFFGNATVSGGGK
ncbi:TRAP transporter small permease [uncultured Sphaerochaeta sp.]|uniref:TRAP transporter small permease n=1 Tax=uncultured Sphaerochaeta sp. TaxID=886478 RepID=UPI002A0A9BBE|nr:TRAP transporter small permease [uncultured Sphaerochaeta sp.]